MEGVGEGEEVLEGADQGRGVSYVACHTGQVVCGCASLMIVLPIVVAKNGCEVKRHILPVPLPVGIG